MGQVSRRIVLATLGSCILFVICVLGQGTIPQGEGEYLDPFTVPDSQPNASDGKSLAQLYLEKRIRELEYELKLARSELARITSTEVSQPTEPASSAATLPARSVQPSEIPQGALVVVSGPKGSGSGFVAEMKGRTFFCDEYSRTGGGARR